MQTSSFPKWQSGGVSEVLYLASKLACMGGDKTGMWPFQLPCDVQRRGRRFLCLTPLSDECFQ